MGRARTRTALAASLAILAALGWPMLLGRVYGGDDLGTFHLPLRDFYARCLAAGDRFEWCPRLFCGFDLHGEGQVGMYHPLHLLLYRALPLATAFNLELLSGYLLMFPGMVAFLRCRGLPRDAALFGAMAFTASGFNLLHYMHLNFVAIVAHLPWLLVAVDAMARGGRHRRWAALAIAALTASQLLLGYPQAAWLSGLVEALYAAGLVAPGLVRARRVTPGAARFLAALLGAKALGVLLGCVQLIPTWDALNHSARAGPSPEFLAHGSLHPANLVQLVAPYGFRDRFYTVQPPRSIGAHELGLYAGAAVPSLLAWLWIRRRALGSDRPLVVVAAGIGAVALLLASGRHGPLFGVVIGLPGVGLFRNPGRAIVLAHLATAILGAVALADLGRLGGPVPWRALRPLALAPALGLLAAGGMALMAWLDPGALASAFVAPIGRLAAGPALVGAAAALVLAAARGRGIALVGLIAFAAADQAAYGLGFVWRSPPASIPALLATRAVPAGSAGHRVKVPEGDDLWIMNGVDLVDGYVALTPARRLHYEDRAALRVAGVRWIAPSTPGGAWAPLPASLPRARLATEVVARAFVGPEIGRAASPWFAFTDRPLDLPGGRPGVAVIVEDRPGSIRVATETPTRQLLVLAERNHEGWQARVDGQSRPVLRVDGDFLGCVVEAGRHEAGFRFESGSLRLGARLSAAGAGLWAVAAAAVGAEGRLRRRRPIVDNGPAPTPRPGPGGSGVEAN